MNCEALTILIVKHLIKYKQTISCSESCTGGMLSEFITRIPGSSNVFAGSVICYSNLSKNRILNIDMDVIKSFTSVSDKVAFFMAKNSKKLFSTTYSLSITGFAGPRKKLESTGIVYFGLANKNNIKTVKQQISGKTRQEIRVNSCVFGLNFIKNNLLI